MEYGAIDLHSRQSLIRIVNETGDVLLEPPCGTTFPIVVNGPNGQVVRNVIAGGSRPRIPSASRSAPGAARSRVSARRAARSAASSGCGARPSPGTPPRPTGTNG